MPPRTTRWNLLRLARLAGVSEKVAYEARDRQVLHPDVLAPSDVLPLKTFDACRRISWPSESRGRAHRQAVRLWESIAIELARVELDSVPNDAGLYVNPQGAELAVTASEHARIALRLSLEERAPHHYLELGEWAAVARQRLAEAEGGEATDELPDSSTGPDAA